MTTLAIGFILILAAAFLLTRTPVVYQRLSLPGAPWIGSNGRLLRTILRPVYAG